MRLSTRQVFPFWLLLTLHLPHEPHDALLDDSFSREIVDAFLEREHPERAIDDSGPMNCSRKGCEQFGRPLRVDTDEPVEVDHADLNAFEGEYENPFSFFSSRNVAMLMRVMLICRWMPLKIQENKRPLTSM